MDSTASSDSLEESPRIEEAPSPPVFHKFLDYPSKVRLKVYKALFEDAKIALIEHSLRHLLGRMGPTRCYTGGSGHILLRCRLCMKKVRSVFYSTATSFLNYGNPSGQKSFRCSNDMVLSVMQRLGVVPADSVDILPHHLMPALKFVEVRLVVVQIETDTLFLEETSDDEIMGQFESKKSPQKKRYFCRQSQKRRRT